MKVFRSMVLDAPVARVWAAVRAFDAVVDWNPGVIAARIDAAQDIWQFCTSDSAVNFRDVRAW